MLIKHGILNILKFRYFGRNPYLYKGINANININNNKFSYQNSSLCWRNTPVQFNAFFQLKEYKNVI